MLGLVVAGGAVGVLARAAIVAPVDDPVVAVWVTCVINVVGSLLLGVLAGRLGSDRPLRNAFWGTGMLGGFTTYSAFAVQTVLLLDSPAIAVALVALSLVAGVSGAAAGLWLGRTLAARRSDST